MSPGAGAAALVVGLVLVIGAADVFVDGLLGVGERLRVAPFTLTVLISGFEAENLAAGLALNAKGLPGAAAGTFLGGVVFLAFAVAGLGGLLAPFEARLGRRFSGWVAVAPLPLLALGLDGELDRLDGALLLAWFAVAAAGTIRSGPGAAAPAARVRRPFARLLGGLAVLTGGGLLLGDGLRAVVRHLGVPATLLGNTAVAASVEAEEVARVVAPSRRDRPELALASLAGTLVHFAALNAGVMALVRPLRLGHETTHFYLPAAAVAPAVLAAVLVSRGRMGRGEGAGLVALYAAYVAAAILTSGS